MKNKVSACRDARRRPQNARRAADLKRGKSVVSGDAEEKV